MVQAKAYHESKKMTLELGEEGWAGGGGGQDLNYIQKIKICIYIRLLDSNKRDNRKILHNRIRCQQLSVNLE